MINSNIIHIDELFVWTDDFIRVTGVSTYAALQIYAECCYFQDPNALLERLLSIENEYNLQIQAIEQDDVDDDPDIDGDIFLEHYSSHQLSLNSLGDEDAKKFSDHYKNVLVHHGFTKQFCVYFIEHFHPLSENATSQAPAIDKRFIFKHQYSSSPFFNEPPEAPAYEWLGIFDRLEREPGIDPAGWIAVFKKLGFSGIDSEAGPSWPAYEPSFFLGPPVLEAKKICEEQGFEYEEGVDFFEIFEQTPVYVTPFSVTGPHMISFDMIELCRALGAENETAIILYSAPYILRSPDNNRFIAIWGEIFDGEAWKIMPLHANSTSLETILEDAFLSSSEPNWQNVSAPDQLLFEIWQTHHRPSKKLSPNASSAEVINFKPDHATD